MVGGAGEDDQAGEMGFYQFAHFSLGRAVVVVVVVVVRAGEVKTQCDGLVGGFLRYPAGWWDSVVNERCPWIGKSAETAATVRTVVTED